MCVMPSPITVPVLQVDVPNGNGRTYPRAVMAAAIASYMLHGTRMGQIGMPEEATLYAKLSGTMAGVDLMRVSHTIEGLVLGEDGIVRGTIHGLPTPRGELMHRLLTLGWEFRTAGIGNVADDGTVTDFTLLSINLVSSPALLNDRRAELGALINRLADEIDSKTTMARPNGRIAPFILI